MDWITPQIAIGNVLDARTAGGEVDTILCLKPNCCSEEREDVEVIALPFIDGPGNRLRDLKEAIESIDAAVQGGENILVHCHAGRSRSVMVVAAYFVACCSHAPQSALSLDSIETSNLSLAGDRRVAGTGQADQVGRLRILLYLSYA